MDWRDKAWITPTVKLVKGKNNFLFLDDGQTVKGKYGEQVLFTVTPIKANGEPDKNHKLYANGVLAEQLKKIPVLTGKRITINRDGDGSNTVYTVEVGK